MRILLQGSIKNEIYQELLPTVQAGLMRRGILVPLLESFEVRSDPSIWQGASPFGYVAYLQAFENRLRLGQYQYVGSRAGALRTDFTLKPILRFIAARRGFDPTDDGAEIDAWLEDPSQFGKINEVEKIFQVVLNSEERMDLLRLGRLENPNRPRRTFEAYWTVPNLMARSLEGNPVDVSGALGARPGKGIDGWKANCTQDFEALKAIYDRLIFRTAIQEHCQVKLEADYLAWQVSEMNSPEAAPSP